jgi:hypothetical protein
MAACLSMLALAGCGGDPSTAQTVASPSKSLTSISNAPSMSTTSSPQSANASLTPIFSTWQIGSKVLPLGPGGYGQILPTPQQLVNRRLATKDLLPPPLNDRYLASVTTIPPEVLARSTWESSCPVAAKDLRYLTLSFWGFDDRAHTGEMIVNASVSRQVTQVFRALFEARFPIEEMKVTSDAELNAPPTGDGNNTSAFVCRPARGQTRWSAHALGLAIDLNPFCNPYVSGKTVLPELASAYVARKNVRPGMVLAGDATVRAFASIGWQWGGSWTNPKDIMHFTANGT